MYKMVDHLEQDQLQSYKEAFDSFDWNHNGKVSSANLQVQSSEKVIKCNFQYLCRV